MRLIQFMHRDRLAVGRVIDTDTVELSNVDGGVYALALTAAREGVPLQEVVHRLAASMHIHYGELVEQGRLLSPLTHPDPAHLHVSGTGLTHLGSAASRDAMHAAPSAQEAASDSMKMFRAGLEGGKPPPGVAGFQPEWFHKGDGGIVVAPEQALPVPSYAQDAGEEPELAGLYIIDDTGRPWRVGFAVGNEFSDHVTERFNYLWLAHSKLRGCAFGPELRVGELPADLQGTSRIVRGGKVLWSKAFVTGEAHMSHSLANLEHHHFKYAQHRRPGDVHVHFFGTATLSFADGVKVQEGDRFEIEVKGFGRPLRNPVVQAPGSEVLVGVSVL